MEARPSTRIGPYRLAEKLGQGGMGTVFRAWDEELERWVAVKLIRTELAAGARAQERLRREARAAAGLSHPAIVQVHHVLTTDDGSDAIVMEWVDGVPLSRLLTAGRLTPDSSVQLAREIAAGLTRAHEHGIVHRDLKTDNIIVTRDGHAKILDFGIAKRLDTADATLTREGAVIGTYRSMSPEQARGLDVDARSDLFAFGSLLYEMVTGRPPFDAAAAHEIVRQICEVQPPLAHEVETEVTPPLSELIDRLLAKDPALRPQSASQVAQELATLDSDEGTALRSLAETLATVEEKIPPPAERPAKPPSERPRRLSWRRLAGGFAVVAITSSDTRPQRVAAARGASAGALHRRPRAAVR